MHVRKARVKARWDHGQEYVAQYIAYARAVARVGARKNTVRSCKEIPALRSMILLPNFSPYLIDSS